MFPRNAVGSVVGIGGMAGALGGATMAVATGYILQNTGQNYSIMFIIAGTLYLLALALIHLLVPRLDAIDDVERVPIRMFSAGTFVGFGFVGLILGSFVGWLFGLISRVAGQVLFKYMIVAGVIGIAIGVIGGLLWGRNERVTNQR
jgi:MFS family permease